ncbi:MAG: flavin-containing monooxygenase [Hyphomicrobiaceae bacterium]
MLDVAVAQVTNLVTRWLHLFNHAVASGDPSNVVDLFFFDAYWRDVLALTWRIDTIGGREEIADTLAAAARHAGLRSCALDPKGPSPQVVTRAGVETIEAFFIFETRVGHGRGIVRLCPDPDDSGSYKSWTFLTALESLNGFEDRVGDRRPTGQSHSRDFRGPNWLDQRRAATRYADREPTALVVGGGQAGLSIAACLSQLGVDTLIVDKFERIGDNWRTRYHALTLHNQVQVNHLPYMPFPPNWPTYIPKDKLANWFEAYVDAMELNYWTATELTRASYDTRQGLWTATLQRRGERPMLIQPRHIIMATGVSGIANIPDIPTLDRFEGQLVHSSLYQDGEDWAGNRAIVIGTGNSGHDIAQDLRSSGADVTLVQRSPTLVVNIEPSAQLPYALYGGDLPLEICDFITLSMPIPLVRKAHIAFTRQAEELDSDLLARLDRVGFKRDSGENGTGWQFKYLTRGGGYYFNVGCSDMIADGRIRLVQFEQIAQFAETGMHLRDGTELPADLIVLATGYKRQEALVKRIFGGEIEKRVGPIWGFGDGHELRNMYVPTGQQGLWFIAGSLAQCRIYSKYLALQIKAREEGLVQ